MHISYKYNIHFFIWLLIDLIHMILYIYIYIYIYILQGRLTINEYMRYFEILEGFPSRQPSMVKLVEEVPS
jgi:hypothetical protein